MIIISHSRKIRKKLKKPAKQNDLQDVNKTYANTVAVLLKDGSLRRAPSAVRSKITEFNHTAGQKAKKNSGGDPPPLFCFYFSFAAKRPWRPQPGSFCVERASSYPFRVTLRFLPQHSYSRSLHNRSTPERCRTVVLLPGKTAP